MTSKLKLKRISAKGRFTHYCNLLERALQDESSDLEDITLYFKDVESAWINVEDKHDECLISLEDDTGSEETWIAEPQSKFQEVRKRYVKFKSEFRIKLEQKAVRRDKDVEDDTFITIVYKIGTFHGG